jgi:hypothetical protein
MICPHLSISKSNKEEMQFNDYGNVLLQDCWSQLKEGVDSCF